MVSGPDWSVLLAAADADLTAPDTGIIGALRARDRKFTWRLTGLHDLELTISGDDELAGDIIPLGTDLLVYRDDELLMRGRINGSDDDIDPDRHDIKLTAQSYLWLVGRRDIATGATLVYDDVAQDSIAWDLIADSQARTGGTLGPGVTRGAHPATTIRDRTYVVGKNIGEALAELGAVNGGFDQDITPQLEYVTFAPTRGTDRDFPIVLVRGEGAFSNVVGLGRSTTPDGYFNHSRMSGADGVTASDLTVADIATRVEGIFDHQDGRTDVTSATHLTELNTRALADGADLKPSYSVALRPDTPDKPGAGWTPSVLWLGDTAPLHLVSGPLAVHETELRVSEVAVAVDDNGGEAVGVTVGAPPPRDYLYAVLSKVVAKLNNLSRR